MKSRKNFKQQEINENKIQIGKFLHLCDKDIVIQLTCPDIPFPNSPVFFNNSKVGIIDEVLGNFNEVFASVKLDKIFDIKKYKKNDIFFGFQSKFLKKERFLSRTETEVKKEKKDKIKKEQRNNDNIRPNKSRNEFNRRGRCDFKKTNYKNKR